MRVNLKHFSMRKMKNHAKQGMKSHFKNISNRRSFSLDKFLSLCYNMGVTKSHANGTTKRQTPSGILAMMIFEDHSQGERLSFHRNRGWLDKMTIGQTPSVILARIRFLRIIHRKRGGSFPFTAPHSSKQSRFTPFLTWADLSLRIDESDCFFVRCFSSPGGRAKELVRIW